MPAVIPIIMAAIQAAIQAAPQVVAVVTSAKNFIGSLVGAGVITADQQATLHAQVDAIAAQVAAGAVPPSWLVQPDPK